MKKILLDTDIGSDIDDAVCLAYLLKQPDCELMGITTVSGEADKRAMIASAICKAAKKDIPIYAGVEKPLLDEQKQPIAMQADALKNWEHETNFPKGEAIEFLRQTIRKNPGEISLVTIGPLTNIALLFSIDPEIPRLLKELVIMCGAFLDNTRISEWNSLCDPHATSIIYKAPVKIHKSVGLDVTRKVVMSKNEVMQNFKSDILKPILDFAGIWFEKRNEIVFHDPLAAACIFDDEICKFEKFKVEVELQSEKLKGMTFLSQGENNHEIATQVNPQRFFQHYFSIVNKD